MLIAVITELVLVVSAHHKAKEHLGATVIVNGAMMHVYQKVSKLKKC